MAPAAPAFKDITYEVRDDKIAVLSFARPERLNSIDTDMCNEARQAIALAGQDPKVRALILTGKGRGFCAGAFLGGGSGSGGFSEAGESSSENRVSVGEGVAHGMKTVWNPLGQDLRTFPKPTLCIVNGPAAGAGVGISLSCDVTIAAKSSYFLQTFVPNLGICPDVGSTWHVGRRIGRGYSLPLALLGPKLQSEEAQKRGLIWEAVDDDKLWARGQELARQLAELPPLAVMLVREAIDAAPNSTHPDSLAREADAQRQLFDNKDSKALMAKTTKKFRDAAEKRASKL